MLCWEEADGCRTPFMLDAYEAEYEEQRRDKEKHAHELDQLRNANRSLSNQVYVNTATSPKRHMWELIMAGNNWKRLLRLCELTHSSNIG